jgi:hypothetical protein
MQVTGAGGARLRSADTAGRARPAAGFSLAGPGIAATAGTAGALPPLGGLLALQDVAEPTAERRRRALGRGRSILDRLDELRLELLAGAVPLDLLRRLQGELGRRVDVADEPRLQGLLDAIEVRCAVEVAKLETAARDD